MARSDKRPRQYEVRVVLYDYTAGNDHVLTFPFWSIKKNRVRNAIARLRAYQELMPNLYRGNFSIGMDIIPAVMIREARVRQRVPGAILDFGTLPLNDP